MNALVSGQAGIAVLPQGSFITVIEADSPDIEKQLPYTALGLVLAGANDVLRIDAASRTELVERLRFEWQVDRALQLSLILFDKDEKKETQSLAIDSLQEFLEAPDVLDRLSHRLYSVPFQDTADIEVAITLAARSVRLTNLFAELLSLQPALRRIHDAWSRLPASIFGDEEQKASFRAALIDAGVFRKLALALEDTKVFALARIDIQSKLATLRNSRRIFNDWLTSLQPREQQSIHTLEDDQYSDYAQHETPLRTTRAKAPQSRYEAFKNVEAQKEAIIGLMKKGDWSHVRKYSEQLRESQLKSGGATFAAKSLCALSQRAKAVSNGSMQLELALMAIEVAPDDAWSHGQVADAFFCLGRYAEAAEHFELAGKLGDERYAATGRARILRGQGRLDEALAAYDNALNNYSDYFHAWIGRAEVLRDMWHLDEALETYDTAIRKFPQDRVPLCGKGAVLADLGRYEEALTVYERCIREFEEDAVPHCGRASVLKQQGRLVEALDAYEKTIEMFPANYVAKSGRGSVLKTLGRFSESLEAYTHVVAEYPYEPVPFSGLAEVYRAKGDLNRALLTYDDAVSRFPHNELVYCGRSNILKELGRLKESLQAYDATLTKFPYAVSAWSSRADLLKELGYASEALVAYETLSRMPWNPKKEATRACMAAVLVTLGRYAEAEKLLSKTEPRTRDEWLGYHILGMILLRKGQLEDAISHFQSGLARLRHADQRQYFESALSVAYIKLKKYREAISILGNKSTALCEVIRMHAYGSINKLGEVGNAYRRVESNCPPPLVPLRDELAIRYGLKAGESDHDSEWLFEEESRNILFEAA